MSRVLIVARTRMRHDHVCIGGHDLDQGFRGIRLLDFFGEHMPESSEFSVGDIWEVEYRNKGSARPPHVEDAFVKTCSFLGRQSRLREFLLCRVAPWRGSPEVLFDGTLHATEHGGGYVPISGRKPRCSTGYWLPDADLRPIGGLEGRFAYSGEGSSITRIKWVGVSTHSSVVPAGTLVRVSLTRAFGRPPSIPEGHYLQLSGAFFDGRGTLNHE